MTVCNLRRAGVWTLLLMVAGPVRVWGGGTNPNDIALPSLPTLISGTPLRFVQRLTGMLPGQSTEVHWELRMAGSAPRLQARKLMCPPSVRGGGGRMAPCPDSAQTAAVSYRGRVVPRPYGVDIWFDAQQPVDGFPGEMTLQCLRTVVGVLPAGAFLQHGDACNGGTPPRWQPGAPSKDVALWLCTIRDEGAQPWSGYGTVGPLAFAAGAGVEWIYVNNDCAGQEGAFRFPLPGK